MMSTRTVALRVVFGAMLLACVNGEEHASSSPPSFEWPDPATNGTVLVNVTQDVVGYLRNHPDYFSNGELVLSFSVPIGPDPAAPQRRERQLRRPLGSGGLSDREAVPSFSVPIGADRAVPEQQYQQLRELLESKGLIVGTYISGTTTKQEAEETRWPYDAVPSERLSTSRRIVGFWPNDPHREIIDVADADTRHALQAEIRWQAHPAPVRFVDNAAAHSSAGGTQSWDAQCVHIREIREIADSLGCRVVFNIALHVGFLSDREAALLIQAVGPNGICLEDPWTPWVRRNEMESKKAEARYRQLLDAGMAVIMLPLNVPEDELERWVNSWNQPAYHLYFGGAFFKRPTHGIRTGPPPV